MKNIQYFILHFYLIIQSFAIGQIENSTHSIDEKWDKLGILGLGDPIIQISRPTPEPTRNSSTNSQEIGTMSGNCRECPCIRGTCYFYTSTDSAKQVAGITFGLYVLLLNTV